jgi:hypothetical protein
MPVDVELLAFSSAQKIKNTLYVFYEYFYHHHIKIYKVIYSIYHTYILQLCS